MKTTIDIPESLYKQAKIRAVETGQTLKDFVIISLIREMELSTSASGEGMSFQNRRQLLPGYEAARKAGAYRPAGNVRDVTEQISEDRSAR